MIEGHRWQAEFGTVKARPTVKVRGEAQGTFQGYRPACSDWHAGDARKTADTAKVERRLVHGLVASNGGDGQDIDRRGSAGQ